MTTTRRFTAHVYVNPSVELAAEISKFASAAGISRTAWVRLACKEYLDKPPQEQSQKGVMPLALQSAVGQRRMIGIGVTEKLKFEIRAESVEKGMKVTEWIIMAISHKMHKEL